MSSYRLPLTVLMLTAWIASCAPATFDGCPAVPEYTAEDQARAAEELRLIPRPSVVRDRFMPDYSVMRDQSRACHRRRSS
jgi:hypothetical protein